MVCHCKLGLDAGLRGGRGVRQGCLMTPHLRSTRRRFQGANAVPVQSAGTALLIQGMRSQVGLRFPNLQQSGQSVAGVWELPRLSSALQDEVNTRALCLELPLGTEAL